jgi:hypothetical protein
VDNVPEDVQMNMYLLYINIDHAENLSIPINKTITGGKQAEQKEKPTWD